MRPAHPGAGQGPGPGLGSGAARGAQAAAGASPGLAVKTLHLLQGETKISDDPSIMMTTILGSCVATCIWDPVVGVGGMNHFLLPGEADQNDKNLRYGVNAMELLVNGLLKKGAQRHRLQAKLFGGAKMYEGGRAIGKKNAEFALWFMQQESLPVAIRCMGGQRGRKIRFWPVSGKAQRMFLDDTRPILQEERQQPDATPRPAAADGGDVELF